ncbi:unnamed protein product [Closterium sp. Yama58-4]|nr:unnamed protein product [Closterium sp. Yama58-4]
MFVFATIVQSTCCAFLNRSMLSSTPKLSPSCASSASPSLPLSPISVPSCPPISPSTSPSSLLTPLTPSSPSSPPFPPHPLLFPRTPPSSPAPSPLPPHPLLFPRTPSSSPAPPPLPPHPFLFPLTPSSPPHPFLFPLTPSSPPHPFLSIHLTTRPRRGLPSGRNRSGGAVGASVPYCTEFDLRTPLSRPSLRHAQQLCKCVPMGVDGLTAGRKGSCTQQEPQNGDSGPTSGFTQDFFGRVSGFLSSLDSNNPADAVPPAPGGSLGAGSRGVGRGGGGGGGGWGERGGRVGRIGVHSLGSPPSLLLSGNDAQSWQVLAWLQWLKGIVQTLPVTVLVTVPREEGVIPPHVLLRLQHAADVVLAMEALEEDNAELASGISDYKDALGLIRIRKVSVQNSLVPRMPAVTTLVLRAVNRKRQIVVEEAHPPPIDATGGAAGSGSGGSSVGCGSSGGASNALDF